MHKRVKSPKLHVWLCIELISPSEYKLELCMGKDLSSNIKLKCWYWNSTDLAQWNGHFKNGSKSIQEKRSYRLLIQCIVRPALPTTKTSLQHKVKFWGTHFQQSTPLLCVIHGELHVYIIVGYSWNVTEGNRWNMKPIRAILRNGLITEGLV